MILANITFGSSVHHRDVYRVLRDLRSMTRVEKALTAARALLDIEGVVGVGQGERDGGACVVVFVATRTPRLEAAIPARILDVPVDIRDSGAFLAY